jgi:hypothetical protein
MPSAAELRGTLQHRLACPRHVFHIVPADPCAAVSLARWAVSGLLPTVSRATSVAAGAVFRACSFSARMVFLLDFVIGYKSRCLGVYPPEPLDYQDLFCNIDCSTLWHLKCCT